MYNKQPDKVAKPTRPLVSVIISYSDERGKPEFLEDWTSHQTLPGELYEVLVVTAYKDGDVLQAIQRRLRPQDRLIRCDVEDSFAHFDLGIRHAAAALLLISEDHCRAKDGCLAAVVKTMEDGTLDATAVRWGHVNLSTVALLENELNEPDLLTWNEPGHWNRVRVRGFAIRRSAYDAVGGLEWQHGKFSEALFAARLHAGNYRIGLTDEVGVLHINSTTLQEIYSNVTAYSRAECRWCETNAEPEFAERYFSASKVLMRGEHLPSGTARWFLRALYSAWRAENAGVPRLTPHGMAWLGYLAALLADASPAGALLFRLRVRARMWRHWTGVYLFWFHPRWRLRSFARLWNAMADYARAEYVTSPAARAVPGVPVDFDASDANSALARGNCWGCHPLETYKDKTFRWTRGIGMFEFDLPPGNYRASIETSGLRGPTAELPVSVFWNHRAIEPELVTKENGSIAFPVSCGDTDTGPQSVTVVTTPFTPGPQDPRWLGLPVCSIDFVPR